jgi:translation initiation factor IF-1
LEGVTLTSNKTELWLLQVKKLVDLTGDVLKDLSNGMFQVKLENGVSVIAHLGGKIRQNRIKVVVGDKVTVGEIETRSSPSVCSVLKLLRSPQS